MKQNTENENENEIENEYEIESENEDESDTETVTDFGALYVYRKKEYLPGYYFNEYLLT